MCSKTLPPSIYFSCTNICVCADSLLSHTEDVQRGSPWDHRQVLQHLVSCYAGPFIGVVPTSVGANLASACGTPSVQVLSSRTIFLRNFHDHRNRFLPGMIDFAIRLMWLQITDVFMVHSLHFCKKLALLAYNWRSSGLTWEYLWSGCTHFICSTKL